MDRAPRYLPTPLFMPRWGYRYSIVGVSGGEINVPAGTLTEGQDMILENLTDACIVVYVRLVCRKGGGGGLPC